MRQLGTGRHFWATGTSNGSQAEGTWYHLTVVNPNGHHQAQVGIRYQQAPSGSRHHGAEVTSGHHWNTYWAPGTTGNWVSPVDTRHHHQAAPGIPARQQGIGHWDTQAMRQVNVILNGSSNNMARSTKIIFLVLYFWF